MKCDPIQGRASLGVTASNSYRYGFRDEFSLGVPDVARAFDTVRIVCLCLVFGCAPLTGQTRSGALCKVSGVRSSQLRLPDGRQVAIDPGSIAWRDGQLAVVGSFNHVWSRGATADSLPILTLEDSLIGVVVDDRGHATPIRNPVPGQHAWHPRVVSAARGAWEVLLFTRSPHGQDPSPVDTESLWYGVVDPHGWSQVERIASFVGAFTSELFSSDLIALDGQLGLAMGFEDPASRDSTKGGVLLLRRRLDHWRIDTIRTREPPTYVRLAADSTRRAFVVGMVQQRFQSGLGSASSLFLTTYDTAWHEPQFVAGDGVVPVVAPIIKRVGESVVASWASDGQWQGGTIRLEFERVPAILTAPITPTVITVGPDADHFDVGVLDSHRAVWIYRTPGSDSGVHLALADNGSVTDLGSISLPIDSPRPRVVAATSSTLVMVSSKLARRPTEPRVTTYITRIELRCSRRT